MRGNHHDAWVNGAADPVSGMAPMLEEARALGELRKQGWTPKRTIVYAAWDGEEPALLGSTEWVESHADELRQNAVAYINTDGNGRGFLSMSGSHTLERFINDVARDIQDPETKLSVWKRRQARTHRPRHAGGSQGRARARATCASARSDRDPTTRRSCSTPASRRSTSASAARTRTASTTRSTTTSISTRTSSTATSSTAARWRRRSARRSSGSPTATCCRSNSPALPNTVETYVKELTDLLSQEAGRGARAQSADRGRRLRGAERPAAAADRAAGRAGAAGDQLRAARERRGGADGSARRYEKALAAARPASRRTPRRCRRSTPSCGRRSAAHRRGRACRTGRGTAICSTRPASTPATA